MPNTLRAPLESNSNSWDGPGIFSLIWILLPLTLPCLQSLIFQRGDEGKEKQNQIDGKQEQPPKRARCGNKGAVCSCPAGILRPPVDLGAGRWKRGPGKTRPRAAPGPSRGSHNPKLSLPGRVGLLGGAPGSMGFVGSGDGPRINPMGFPGAGRAMARRAAPPASPSFQILGFWLILGLFRDQQHLQHLPHPKFWGSGSSWSSFGMGSTSSISPTPLKVGLYWEFFPGFISQLLFFRCHKRLIHSWDFPRQWPFYSFFFPFFLS